MIIDLSHPIGTFAYPGLPPPELRTVVTREETAARLAAGISFEIEALTLVGNTGTYIDSPFHYHADRADIAGLPLERIVDVPVTVVQAAGVTSVGRDRLGDSGRLAGRAVLIHTGWSRHWGTPEYTNQDCPHLTADAVAALIEADVAVVGIDSLNIDNPGDPARPAHQGLLGAGIPIIEHLTNLAAVPDGARLTALPAPVRGMASFPVRAIAVKQG
ncbi:MAG TPA: cyclase family protein [Streptosporangiaceae bacterium]